MNKIVYFISNANIEGIHGCSSYLCSVYNTELFKFIRTTESEKNEIVLLLIERFGTLPSFTATLQGLYNELKT